ncbi:MAG: hypothetical protein ACRYE9_05070 [Janthinobacterium lividum]
MFFDTYNDLRNAISISYYKVFPSKLLKALFAEIDKHKFLVIELIRIIKGQIFSCFEETSPVPISIFAARVQKIYRVSK